MLSLKRLLSMGAGMLLLAGSLSAYGQSASQTSSQGDPKTTSPSASAQQADNTSSANEPASLGELARLARAKKQGAAKSAKLLDDDNFQRSSYPVDEKVADGPAGAGSPAQGSSGQGRGKYVLLDFWASWCGPCRRALPGVKRLRLTYGDQLQVVSISADDDENTWRAFVASHDMNWEQKFDGDGTMRAKYQVNAFPTYILLGPDGKVVQRLVGEDPTQSIAERLGPNLRASAETSR
jgi:thiol-disulfide isomerase/thioredoxin